jgi:hypothetical protein
LFSNTTPHRESSFDETVDSQVGVLRILRHSLNLVNSIRVLSIIQVERDDG